MIQKSIRFQSVQMDTETTSFRVKDKSFVNVSKDMYVRESDSGMWKIVDKNVARTKFILTLFQMLMIFLVILSCILNISFGNGNSEMWVSFLGLAFGAILPNPKVKKIVSNSHIKDSSNSTASSEIGVNV